MHKSRANRFIYAERLPRQRPDAQTKATRGYFGTKPARIVQHAGPSLFSAFRRGAPPDSFHRYHRLKEWSEIWSHFSQSPTQSLAQRPWQRARRGGEVG